MDKVMVKAIEAVWTAQKRLPALVDNCNNQITFALAVSLMFALHIIFLTVIITLVLVRWIATSISQIVKQKIFGQDLTFATN